MFTSCVSECSLTAGSLGQEITSGSPGLVTWHGELTYGASAVPEAEAEAVAGPHTAGHSLRGTQQPNAGLQHQAVTQTEPSLAATTADMEPLGAMLALDAAVTIVSDAQPPATSPRAAQQSEAPPAEEQGPQPEVTIAASEPSPQHVTTAPEPCEAVAQPAAQAVPVNPPRAPTIASLRAMMGQVAAAAPARPAADSAPATAAAVPQPIPDSAAPHAAATATASMSSGAPPAGNEWAGSHGGPTYTHVPESAGPHNCVQEQAAPASASTAACAAPGSGPWAHGSALGAMVAGAEAGSDPGLGLGHEEEAVPSLLSADPEELAAAIAAAVAAVAAATRATAEAAGRQQQPEQPPPSLAVGASQQPQPQLLHAQEPAEQHALEVQHLQPQPQQHEQQQQQQPLQQVLLAVGPGGAPQLATVYLVPAYGAGHPAVSMQPLQQQHQQQGQHTGPAHLAYTQHPHVAIGGGAPPDGMQCASVLLPAGSAAEALPPAAMALLGSGGGAPASGGGGPAFPLQGYSLSLTQGPGGAQLQYGAATAAGETWAGTGQANAAYAPGGQAHGQHGVPVYAVHPHGQQHEPGLQPHGQPYGYGDDRGYYAEARPHQQHSRSYEGQPHVHGAVQAHPQQQAQHVQQYPDSAYAGPRRPYYGEHADHRYHHPYHEPQGHHGHPYERPREGQHGGQYGRGFGIHQGAPEACAQRPDALRHPTPYIYKPPATAAHPPPNTEAAAAAGGTAGPSYTRGTGRGRGDERERLRGRDPRAAVGPGVAAGFSAHVPGPDAAPAAGSWRQVSTRSGQEASHEDLLWSPLTVLYTPTRDPGGDDDSNMSPVRSADGAVEGTEDEEHDRSAVGAKRTGVSELAGAGTAVRKDGAGSGGDTDERDTSPSLATADGAAASAAPREQAAPPSRQQVAAPGTEQQQDQDQLRAVNEKQAQEAVPPDPEQEGERKTEAGTAQLPPLRARVLQGGSAAAGAAAAKLQPRPLGRSKEAVRAEQEAATQAMLEKARRLRQQQEAAAAAERERKEAEEERLRERLKERLALQKASAAGGGGAGGAAGAAAAAPHGAGAAAAAKDRAARKPAEQPSAAAEGANDKASSAPVTGGGSGGGSGGGGGGGGGSAPSEAELAQLEAELERLQSQIDAAPTYGLNARALVLRAAELVAVREAARPAASARPAAGEAADPGATLISAVKPLADAVPVPERPFVTYVPRSAIPRLVRQEAAHALTGGYLALALQAARVPEASAVQAVSSEPSLRKAAAAAAAQHEMSLYRQTTSKSAYEALARKAKAERERLELPDDLVQSLSRKYGTGATARSTAATATAAPAAPSKSAPAGVGAGAKGTSVQASASGAAGSGPGGGGSAIMPGTKRRPAAPAAAALAPAQGGAPARAATAGPVKATSQGAKQGAAARPLPAKGKADAALGDSDGVTAPAAGGAGAAKPSQVSPKAGDAAINALFADSDSGDDRPGACDTKIKKGAAGAETSKRPVAAAAGNVVPSVGPPPSLVSGSAPSNTAAVSLDPSPPPSTVFAAPADADRAKAAADSGTPTTAPGMAAAGTPGATDPAAATAAATAATGAAPYGGLFGSDSESDLGDLDDSSSEPEQEPGGAPAAREEGEVAVDAGPAAVAGAPEEGEVGTEAAAAAAASAPAASARGLAAAERSAGAQNGPDAAGKTRKAGHSGEHRTERRKRRRESGDGGEGKEERSRERERRRARAKEREREKRRRSRSRSRSRSRARAGPEGSAPAPAGDAGIFAPGPLPPQQPLPLSGLPAEQRDPQQPQEEWERSETRQRLRHQVLTFIHATLEPLYRAGLLGKEPYKRVAAKSTEKLLAAHPDDVTADFLVREHAQVSKFIMKMVEREQQRELELQQQQQQQQPTN